MASTTTKRAWKLHEFVAHGANVNCVALGHKTGRVMVTGGDDRKVNLWTVGKPNCVMSLSGHTSAVEAVRFGNAEEMVVAGSMSGALKIWDLEQAKIIRTLTGHKANIRCLDFHPYGDFVASGSLDTNVKLWDIRRKGCIFTYKGHTNGVNCIRFSPDGRWVASASEDSVIKIWDLAAGKLLADLRQHGAAVNSIEFHPSEYLLASGSSDRSIKFWELEKFQCVDSTDFDNNAIRSVVFHPDGACIFGGSSELIKVYGWEPSKCFDSVSMGWGKVADMAIAQTQLIGVSINQSNVSTFVLDLTRTAPIGEVPGTPTPPLTSGSKRGYLHERPPTTSTKQAPPPSSPKNSGTARQVNDNDAIYSSISKVNSRNGLPSSPSLPSSRLGSRSRSPSINGSRSGSPSSLNSNNSKRRSQSRNSDSTSSNSNAAYVFKHTRSSELRRSCSMMVNLPTNNSQTVSEESNNNNKRPVSKTLLRSSSALASSPRIPAKNTHKDSTLSRQQRRKTALDRNSTNSNSSNSSTVRDIPITIYSKSKPAEEPEDSASGNAADDGGDDALSTADVKDPTEYEQVFKPKSKLSLSPPQKMDPFPAPKDDGEVSVLAANFKATSVVSNVNNKAAQPTSNTQATSRTNLSYMPPPAVGPQYPSKPSPAPPALNPEDFMPPSMQKVPQQLNDSDAIAQISKGHSSMSALLSARSKNLQIIRAMWSSGNIRTALDSAIQMKDDSVIVDILHVLNDRPSYWRLDVVDTLLRPILKLLRSKYEEQLWNLDVAALLLVHIKKLIISKYESHVAVSCASFKLILKTFSPLIRQNLQPPDRLGVDISAEERHRKCMNIYRTIQDIRVSIDGKQYQAGKLGGTFKEIQLLLNHLDT